MIKSLVCIAVAAALAAPAAFAHDPKEHDPKTQTQSHDMSTMPMEHTDHDKMAATEFAALDKNKDGRLSKAEIPAKHAVAPHFGMLDANKDGNLSPAEYAKAKGM